MSRLAFCAVAALLCSLAPAADPPKKKVLTHADQDIWNTATGVTVSPNGQFVAYIQTPPAADGHFILKNVSTGAEHKVAVGARAAAPTGGPPADGEEEDQIVPPVVGGTATPRGPAGNPVFTPDSKFVYFPLTPTKADLDKARADKKNQRIFERPNCRKKWC